MPLTCASVRAEMGPPMPQWETLAAVERARERKMATTTTTRRGKTHIDPEIIIADVRCDDTMLWITLTVHELSGHRWLGSLAGGLSNMPAPGIVPRYDAAPGEFGKQEGEDR